MNLTDLQPAELNNLKQALQFTLKWEGKFSDDPDDPGGMTKWGIASAYHPEVRNPDFSENDALQIYLDDYWRPSGAYIVPFPGCVAVFDTAVNCGPGEAKSWIDWTQNPFDPQTYLDQRVAYYIDRVKKKPAKKKFLAGWMNRVNDLRKYCQINSQ